MLSRGFICSGISPSDSRHGDQNQTSVRGPSPIYGSGEGASDEPEVALHGGQLSESVSGDASISPRADSEVEVVSVTALTNSRHGDQNQTSESCPSPIYGSGEVAVLSRGVICSVSDVDISPRADSEVIVSNGT